jgi:hypothetical protein
MDALNSNTDSISLPDTIQLAPKVVPVYHQPGDGDGVPGGGGVKAKLKSFAQ